MAINKVVYGNQSLIDLTEDTVTPETLLKGVVAHDKSGARIVGTMEQSHYKKESGNLVIAASGSKTYLTLDFPKTADLLELFITKTGNTFPDLGIASLSATGSALDTVEFVQTTKTSENTQRAIAGATQLSIVVKPNGGTYDLYYQFYNGSTVSALYFLKSMQSGSSVQLHAFNKTSGWNAPLECEYTTYIYNTKAFTYNS